ncbi:DNA mismatch repair protein, C-terminal domain-containing protein [Toxoplasma gondii GAB2-2007-GAL-DOM2]|uniref:DNA mismatch repair protein, C-terminal domain-containing protein n=1 Tax=Toxoplasma gondii GAB2-2007-GAL-DOM2 TaxID=1130820 RepID=A0A086JHP6_TOXGO|nr:DNA mismatch repair protein, C-terminal domain-containing protein [Toxoplasma gondii GAB2-2007-GAL-DOM2]
MEGEVASKVSSGDREGIQETDEKEEEGGRVKNRCQETEANAGGLRPPVAVQDGRASTGSSCVKAAASSDAEQNSQSSHLSSEDILGSASASSFSSLSFHAFAHAASSSTSLRPQSTSSDASFPLPSSSSTRSSAPSESSASSCSGSSSASSPSSLSTSSTSSSSSSSSASSSSSSASPSSFSSAASPASSSAVRSSSSGGAESERDTGRQAGRLHAMSSLVAEAVCSQQVVLGLKSICKELVENAIDAGATTVEVRFVDGGMASVEVRDNGSGIAPQDFPMLGRRHATSKINKFTDLYSALDTMGFRGEALASLCALSDVEILTRTASEPFATRLRFDHHGKIIHQEPAAREVGTSVTVSNLFASLPLRRRALRQQRQKHLQESLAFLQKFALLHADDCRILVTDFTPANSSRSAEASSGSQRRNGGSSVTLLNTRGTATRLLDAAVTVYGERQMQQCTQVSLAGAEPGREWSVEALLSRPPLGVRTSALQLFFVNKRVVEFPPLLQKLINKKYREVCSRHCFPIVIAFATVAPHLLEVNLRKDKQEVLLAVEKEITEALLKTITDFVAPTVASFQTVRGFSQLPRGVSFSSSAEASSRGSCSSSTLTQRSPPSDFSSPSQPPRLPSESCSSSLPLEESCSPSLPSEESCSSSPHTAFRSPAAAAKRETDRQEEDGTSRGESTRQRAGVDEARLRLAQLGEQSGETRDLKLSGDLKEGDRSTREPTSVPEKENVADETFISCFSSVSSPPFLSASSFPALDSTSSCPPSAVPSNLSALEGETRDVHDDHDEEGDRTRRRRATSPQTQCSSDEENLPLSVRLEKKPTDQRRSSFHSSSSTACFSSSSSLVSQESSSFSASKKGRTLHPSKPKDAEVTVASSESSSPCSLFPASRWGSPDGGAEREREEQEKADQAKGKRSEEADAFGSFERRRKARKGVPSRAQLKRREDEFVSESKLLKETVASAVAECHCTEEDLEALYGASDAETGDETKHEAVSSSSSSPASSSSSSFSSSSASSSASPCASSFRFSDCPAAFSFASSSDTQVIGAFDPGTSSMFLDKRAFREMKIVGQFNQGFIIGCLLSRVPSGACPPDASGGSHEFRQVPQTPDHVSPSFSASSSSSSSSASASSFSSSLQSALPASKREVRSLFIVDQHASDEKKRFEDLNEGFKPATQPLLIPLRLHLPVDMARAVSDFDREIRENGFRVTIARERRRLPEREERDATCAGEASEDAADASVEDELVISLSALPVVEGRQLKEEDFIEFLAALLHDEEGHATAARWRRRRRRRRKRTTELTQKRGEPPETPEKPSEEAGARGGDAARGPQAAADEVDVQQGSGSEKRADEDDSDEGEEESEEDDAHAFHHRVLLCRPKKVWEILASRACRSAIMIGDSLTVNQMQTVLKNLATLHLPFNCPHGRPTVRHLFDLHLPAVYPPEREARPVPWERQTEENEAEKEGSGEAEEEGSGEAAKGEEEFDKVEERTWRERMNDEMEATGNWGGRRGEQRRLKGEDASSPDKKKGGVERREEKQATRRREEEGDVVGGRFRLRRKRCREEKKRGEKRRKKKKVEQSTRIGKDLSAEQHRELTKAQAHRQEEKDHQAIFAEEKGLFDEDDPDVVADGEEKNEQNCLSLRDWKEDDRGFDATSRVPQMKLYELSFDGHK